LGLRSNQAETTPSAHRGSNHRLGVEFYSLLTRIYSHFNNQPTFLTENDR
jgi:hypothetical protein